MYRNFLLLITFTFLFLSNIFSQSITLLDSTFALNDGALTPLDIIYDYCYSQTIWRQNNIQGSGTVTGLKYYFAGTSFGNSDSLLIYLGNTSWDYFDENAGKRLIPLRRMRKVFLGKVTYTTLPGTINISLDTPFIYNSDSNLVVAVCDVKPGNDFPVNNKAFFGYGNDLFGSGLSAYVTSSLVDLNPMDPAVVEQNPNNYLGGHAGVAKITLVGLTSFLCHSPRQVYFSNITHNNAKVIWSPPLLTSPSFYDIYYSPDRNKPFKPTIPLASVNAPDTQVVINNLLADTMYYVWLRSRCGSADTSVWTYIDSFQTICAPLPISTVVEPFTNLYGSGFDAWLPHCWAYGTGYLTGNSQINYPQYDVLSSTAPWRNREWRNQSSSTNFAEMGLLVGARQNWLISPSYDLGTSGNKNLEFDLALTKNGSTQQGTLDADDQFAVVISTDNGLTWNNANILQQWVAPQTISGTGQHVSIPLNSYSGFVRIGFYAASSSSTNLNNLFVDNVQIIGVMPVTLLSFTGQKQDNRNLLQWRTATEQNNRGFELQKSANGIDFSSIAFVPTKAATGGNSTAELHYNYTDAKPFPAGSYYRLKQVDFDGKATLTNIVFVKGEGATQLSVASLYPNPTHNQINIVLLSPAVQKLQLIITDIAGKILQLQALQLQKGENNKVVNVAALAKGSYIVKLVCADGCEAAVSKFVKE